MKFLCAPGQLTDLLFIDVWWTLSSLWTVWQVIPEIPPCSHHVAPPCIVACPRLPDRCLACAGPYRPLPRCPPWARLFWAESCQNPPDREIPSFFAIFVSSFVESVMFIDSPVHRYQAACKKATFSYLLGTIWTLAVQGKRTLLHLFFAQNESWLRKHKILLLAMSKPGIFAV